MSHFVLVTVWEIILLELKYTHVLGNKNTYCCEKSRCKACFDLKQTDTFEIFVTKKLYKINHYFNCDSKCFIYLFHERCVVFIMQVPHLVDFDSGGSATKVSKGKHQMVEHPTKTISINYFKGGWPCANTWLGNYFHWQNRSIGSYYQRILLDEST